MSLKKAQKFFPGKTEEHIISAPVPEAPVILSEFYWLFEKKMILKKT